MNTPPPNPEAPASDPRRPRLASWTILLIIATAIAWGAGYFPRRLHAQQLLASVSDAGRLSVHVAHPAPGQSESALPIPAEIKPLNEAVLYARANGYVKRWRVDLGAEVKSGELLAEIDTPEIDQELEHARAQKEQASAALALARTTADRWAQLLKTASVSEQEAAEKKADADLKAASLNAAGANVKLLEELKSFSRIVAPFSGTVTARRIELGDLVTSSGRQELFRIAQTDRLRVFVRVPETWALQVRAGDAAELTVPAIRNRSWTARVARSAGAIDPASRTLLVELELENEKRELLAGSYAQLRFVNTNPQASLTVPSSSLLFRSEGPHLALVGADDRIELRRVTPGRDFGQTLEILAGVDAADRIVANPPDYLRAGTSVRVATPPPPQANAR